MKGECHKRNKESVFMTYDETIKLIEARIDELHYSPGELIRDCGLKRDAVYRLLGGKNVGFFTVHEILDRIGLVLVRKEEIENKSQKCDNIA